MTHTKPPDLGNVGTIRLQMQLSASFPKGEKIDQYDGSSSLDPPTKNVAGGHLGFILETYLRNVTDRKPSAGPARHAAKLLLNAFGEFTPVWEIPPRHQRLFIRQSCDLGHSVGYIARNLSVLSAALNYALNEGVITQAPHVISGKRVIADILAQPLPAPREWIPSLDQLAEMLDAVTYRDRHLQRYLLIALTTAARPAAITDLTPAQFLPGDRLVDMNVPGRPQTRKFRPVIRTCDHLFEWLGHWDGPRYVHRNGRPVNSTRKGLASLAERVGVTQMTRYALRHFVATELHRRGAHREEVATLLGHRLPNFHTTDRYIKFSPDYLSRVAGLLDEMVLDIQERTRDRLIMRKLYPVKAPPHHPRHRPDRTTFYV